MKLWHKNYNLNKAVEDYTVGNDYILDSKLVKYDCIASIAHAQMLNKIGVLKISESKKIISELKKIQKNGLKISKSDEDCHTAIENHLVKKLGSIGKKIHTGRSRNDQVLTALRLYYKQELSNLSISAQALIKSLKIFGKNNKIKFPGYTHTRKAMPSTISLWSEAFAEALQDDMLLLASVKKLIDQSPLGTGAGYGVPLNVNRKFTAGKLGFAKVQANSIYVQNSRGKFEASILHVVSQIMADLNKLASDLIIFSMPEIGYFELSSEFCTGSSIMPQKKNPDVLELLRAKYHVVVSYEYQVKAIYGNLISGYHRDMQLTKEPVMRGVDIGISSLKISKLIIDNLKVNKENCAKAMTSELFATEEVFKLVKKGIPFRDAYQKVAKKL